MTTLNTEFLDLDQLFQNLNLDPSKSNSIEANNNNNNYLLNTSVTAMSESHNIDYFNQTTESINSRHNNDDIQSNISSHDSLQQDNNHTVTDPSPANLDTTDVSQPQIEPIETTRERIAVLQLTLTRFRNELKTWCIAHDNDFDTLRKNYEQNSKEYSQIRSQFAQERGVWCTRLNQAIAQGKLYKIELEKIMKELDEVHQKTSEYQQDIKLIKQNIIELQSTQRNLLYQLKQRKISLKNELVGLKDLLRKYELFLGVEIQQISRGDVDQFNQNSNNVGIFNASHDFNHSSTPYHHNNDDDECLLINYKSVSPQMSFLLYIEPELMVQNMSLQLPGYHRLEKQLEQTKNLHQFLVQLYFLHKQTYNPSVPPVVL